MSQYVAADLRRRVRDHFSECCAYCRSAERLTVVTFEIEHIVPLSADGGTVFENLCLACPMCNRHKADRTLANDPVTNLQVVLFHPHQHIWREHFAWNVDCDQILPLSDIGRGTVELLHMNRPQLVRVRRLWVALLEHPPMVV